VILTYFVLLGESPFGDCLGELEVEFPVLTQRRTKIPFSSSSRRDCGRDLFLPHENENGSWILASDHFRHQIFGFAAHFRVDNLVQFVIRPAVDDVAGLFALALYADVSGGTLRFDGRLISGHNLA
jgi:hypothetical protein